MKLVLAIINNDDAAGAAAALTQEGYTITKLSTTGGFLQAGNTTLLIGAEDNQVAPIKEILRQYSFTRCKAVPSFSAYGHGIGPNAVPAQAKVTGATVFVVNVEDFEKL
ncbi:MAG: cyclic-di-AMP receptor [Clostridia bacterium]|nr:cyclic-di-AMP receptor [Clostridia bacterium]